MTPAQIFLTTFFLTLLALITLSTAIGSAGW